MKQKSYYRHNAGRRKRSLRHRLPIDTMIYAGPQVHEDRPVFTLIRFGQDFYDEKVLYHLDDSKSLLQPGRIVWLDLSCIHHYDAVETIGNLFNLHYLTLDDIRNTDERAKVAEFDHYLLLLMKMIYYSAEHDRINYEQVSIIFGTGFVITFQEFEGDAFQAVRNRLKDPADIIRSGGADYLAFTLAGAITDGYYSVLDVFTDTIEDLELELSDPSNDPPNLQKQFHLMRYEMMLLRRAVQPFIYFTNRLATTEHPAVDPANRKYVADISDHINQISETVVIQREMLDSLQDIHMANNNQKMNQIMKTLTLVTTVFIPLSFIVGVYGMNFEHMPELKLKYAYFTVWGLMITTVSFMIYIFRKKKWL